MGILQGHVLDEGTGRQRIDGSGSWGQATTAPVRMCAQHQSGGHWLSSLTVWSAALFLCLSVLSAVI